MRFGGRTRLVVVAVAALGATGVARAQLSNPLSNTSPPANAPRPAPPSSGASGMSNTRPQPAPSIPQPSRPVAPAARASAPPSPGPAAAQAPQPQAAPQSTASSPTPVRPLSVVQNPTGIEIRDLVFSVGPMTYRIASAQVTGSPLAADDLRNILDPASPMPVAERVQRMAAAEITIPEVVGIVEAAGGRQVTTYRGVTFRNMAGGRIGSVGAESGTMSADGPTPVQGGFGRMELSEMDLGLAAQLFSPTPDAATMPLRPLYKSFSLLDFRTAGGSGPTVKIARLAGRDFMARPTVDGWAGTVGRLANVPPDAPGSQALIFGAMAEMFDAYDIGSMEATGTAFEGPDGTGSIARIGYTGGSGRTSELRLEGFDGGGKDGRVKVSEVALGGFSIRPTLDAMRTMTGKSPEDIGPGELRRLIPTLGTFRIGGLDVDVPGTEGKPVKFAVAMIELSADKPIENIPTDVRTTVRSISVPIGQAQAPDAPTQQLAALGYSSLDASFGANLGWNEPGQELVLRDLSAQAQGVGSLTVRAVIGNVTRDIFNPDQAIATVAAVSAAAKSVDVVVENGGLVERILARDAKEKGRSVDDLRREYGVMAAIGIPAMLGDSPSAKNLGQAVARFVAKPSRLTVQVRPKSPAGLGFSDFATAADPTQLLDKVDITATAE